MVTATSFDVTYTRPGHGFLEAVKYVPTATTPFVATADFRLESTDGLIVVMTSAVQLTTDGWIRYPRAAQETAAGATTTLEPRIPIHDQRLKVTVFNSTLAAMTGTFDIFLDGNWYEA